MQPQAEEPCTLKTVFKDGRAGSGFYKCDELPGFGYPAPV